ncbi:MAG TPA: hypothetical protein VN041_09675 [Microbacterium sp.]|nr:hypothetical protein [Microbacterium sp.]
MTAFGDLRAQLENDLLANIEPGKFRWVPAQTRLDRPAKPTLMLKLSTVSRHPGAQQVLMPSFVVTVVSEHADQVQADIDLDGLLDELIAAIQPIRWVAFRSAEKAQFQSKYLCYDIQLEALTTIKKEA